MMCLSPSLTSTAAVDTCSTQSVCSFLVLVDPLFMCHDQRKHTSWQVEEIALNVQAHRHKFPFCYTLPEAGMLIIHRTNEMHGHWLWVARWQWSSCYALILISCWVMAGEMWRVWFRSDPVEGKVRREVKQGEAAYWGKTAALLM